MRLSSNVNSVFKEQVFLDKSLYESASMLTRRPELRHLLLACFVVLFGLFNSGLENDIAAAHPMPSLSWPRSEAVRLTYHFRKETREELFYRCFGEMALGRQHNRIFLSKHRGDLGQYGPDMIGPEVVTGPVLPYRDYIAEYPPVNVPFIVAPSLVNTTSNGYSLIFRFILGLLNGAALILTAQLALKVYRSAEDVRNVLLLSLAAAICLGPIMVTRLDPIALFFFVYALSAASADRPIRSAVGLALATGAKIVPVFLVPHFFLHWWMKKDRNKAIQFGVATVASLGLIFLPPALIGGDNFWNMLRFHGERPIQVESTYAALLRIQQLFFGSPVELIHSFGSWNLASPNAKFLQSLSTPLALVVVATMLWLYRGWLVKAPDIDENTRTIWLLRACGATVAGLMVVSKVFSPQYLIWFWPWIFLAETDKRYRFAGLCLVAFFLTQLLTQVYDTSMVIGEPLGTALLAARNLSLFLILCFLARQPVRVATAESTESAPARYAQFAPLLPLGLALLSLVISIQAQSLLYAWREPIADLPPQSCVRVEYDSPTEQHSRFPGRGFASIEMELVAPRRTFAWTVESDVVQWLPEMASGCDYQIEFEVINALPDIPQDGLKVSMNGRAVELSSSQTEWPKRYVGWVPQEFVAQRKLNRLDLETPEPTSPSEMGISIDSRKLGLQVDWLSLNSLCGFARLLTIPNPERLERLGGQSLVARIKGPDPSLPNWRSLGQDYWEGPLAELKPQLQTPRRFWLYRPGHFHSDFTQLPLGPGWSKAQADWTGRPFRSLIGQGQLSLHMPQGRTHLSFTALKESPDAKGPDLELKVDGEKVELTRQEGRWETVFEATLSCPGGVSNFVFSERSMPWSRKAALSDFSLTP